MTTSSQTAVSAGPGTAVTVTVLLVASMTVMANATISPSLPGLKEHFADTPGIDTLAGLILTLPSASVILAAGLFGWAADRWNRLALLVFSLVCYGLGGASGLVAQSLTELLAGRALLGLGVAGSMTLAMAYATDLWHGPARARYMGLQGAAMSGGGVVVMVLGGLLASLHWRGAFAVYLIALPIALAALLLLRPHTARRGALASGVQAGETAEGGFPWGLFAFTGGLAFVFMSTFYMMPTRMPFRLAEMGVTDSAFTGMIMAGMMLAATPGALFYGRIRQYASAMTVFATSFALMASGFLLISQTASLPLSILGVMITGLGIGPSMANYTTYFLNRVPANQRGRAAGMLTTAFFVGQFSSPLVSAPLVKAFEIQGAFLVLAAVMAAISLGLFGRVARAGGLLAEA
ncbi:MFS transporter [Frigidibacter sp. MR17.14]|uniref:MFS transporter n=1 Tax=Frigidibacter sp. MR17.14 TaxID=3126509 RepID=UPI003012F63E